MKIGSFLTYTRETDKMLWGVFSQLFVWNTLLFFQTAGNKKQKK